MPFQDIIKYGVNTGNTYGNIGEIASQAFQEGEQRVRDMQDRIHLEDERKRVANEREQKELDAFYGDLYVPPTGSVSYDSGVEMMGREWKAEYAALNAAKKRGEVDNDTYVQQKHAIRNRAQELKAGQAALNTSFQTYQKAVGENMVSDSTPAKTKLFYQAVEDGTVQIQNIDGVPTLVGEVADGEPVEIPLAALANGTAGLKFNQKVDTTGLVDTVAKTLEGYKTTIATDNGLALGNVGWEQIQDRAAQDINQLLNNASTVQAIAADDLGMNSEAIAALGPEELEDRVGDYLLDKVQKEYFPIEKFSTYRPDQPNVPGGGVQPNASLIKVQQDIDKQRQIASVLSSVDPLTGGLSQLSGLGGYKVEFDDGFFSDQYIITDSKGNKQKLSPEDAHIFLQNTLIGAPGQEQGQQQSNQVDQSRVDAIKARLKQG